MDEVPTYFLYSLHEDLLHNQAGSSTQDGGPGLSRGPQGHIHLDMDCDTLHLHMLAPVGIPSHSCSLLLFLFHLKHDMLGEK